MWTNTSFSPSPLFIIHSAFCLTALDTPWFPSLCLQHRLCCWTQHPLTQHLLVSPLHGEAHGVSVLLSLSARQPEMETQTFPLPPSPRADARSFRSGREHPRFAESKSLPFLPASPQRGGCGPRPLRSPCSGRRGLLKPVSNSTTVLSCSENPALRSSQPYSLLQYRSPVMPPQFRTLPALLPISVPPACPAPAPA